VLSAIAATMLTGPAVAEDVMVDMYAVSAEGVGKKIGTVRLADSDNGLVIEADLGDLIPGPHGFHLHETGSCDPAANAEGQTTAALAAGGHYDPDGTGKHLGPSGDGHKGDLPLLQVLPNEYGEVKFKRVMAAPRLAIADASGRALVIHDGADNYRDEPKPLGGGGARIACGVVP
jgi:Cu-Zn family superoxide dismutase